jgi:hypothetical protein
VRVESWVDYRGEERPDFDSRRGDLARAAG